MEERIVIIITTLADRASARAVAEALVRERLAACVNVMSECASIYRWQGKVETATEVPLWIKTRASLTDAVQQFIRTHHAYELPEIIVLPVSAGLQPYLEWVVDQTSATTVDSERS
jgi:periplasmic divalent cation tolerance protein